MLPALLENVADQIILVQALPNDNHWPVLLIVESRHPGFPKPLFRGFDVSTPSHRIVRIVDQEMRSAFACTARANSQGHAVATLRILEERFDILACGKLEELPVPLLKPV